MRRNLIPQLSSFTVFLLEIIFLINIINLSFQYFNK